MDYYHKYIKYKSKYLEAQMLDTNHNNVLSPTKTNAIFMFCILKDHYVLGACITAFVHKSFINNLKLDIELVIMCDDYIYEKYEDTLNKYFDRVINVKLRYFESSHKYQYPKEKYSSWIGYSLNKWQILKYVEYNKILFLDIDIMVCDKKFYDIFNFNTPALHMKPIKFDCHNDLQYTINIGKLSYDEYIHNDTKYNTLDGGIVLVTPNLNTYNEYFEMVDTLYKNGIYSSLKSGPDETSLCYYFMKNDIPIYNICTDNIVVPWDDREYVNIAKSYNFLSFVKPWTKPIFLSWEEEMIWRSIYDIMPHHGNIEFLFKDVIEKAIDIYIAYPYDKKKKYYNNYYTRKYNNNVDDIIKSNNKFSKIMELDSKIPITNYGILNVINILNIIE
jgi:hypothetical protein